MVLELASVSGCNLGSTHRSGWKPSLSSFSVEDISATSVDFMSVVPRPQTQPLLSM